MRRGILPIVGSRIEDVRPARCAKRPIVIDPKPATFRRRAVGRSITGVDRAGKRVVVRLDSHEAIVFEPRMTGLVLLAAAPTAEHVRLRIKISGREHHELVFWDRRGLGSVRLVTPAEFDERYGEKKLGPDALAVEREELAGRFGHSRREIKVALLDKRALAGVGNLYASEILHRSGIHPRRRCDQMRAAEWHRLHAAMREVLDEAIRHEGSTLGDGTYRNALNEQGGYQNHHRVYDRAGDACPTCQQAQIQRIVQAQRSTFFCPSCQPRRAARKTER
jgi:formamidopyrimidine-DNA glycosylase